MDSFFLFQSAQKIFGGDVKNHILLFVKKDGNEDVLEGFSKAAADFKGKVRNITDSQIRCIK